MTDLLFCRYLDTNCLIHILGKEAEHRWLFDEILEGRVKLAVSTPILNEYTEILDAFFESKTLQ
jgi:predicted nucleic acid-binding protein